METGQVYSDIPEAKEEPFSSLVEPMIENITSAIQEEVEEEEKEDVEMEVEKEEAVELEEERIRCMFDARKVLFNTLLFHFPNNKTPLCSDLHNGYSLLHFTDSTNSDSSNTGHTPPQSSNVNTSTRASLIITCAFNGCTHFLNLLDASKIGTKGLFFMDQTLTWECSEHQRIPPSFCMCTHTDVMEMIQCHNCNGW